MIHGATLSLDIWGVSCGSCVYKKFPRNLCYLHFLKELEFKFLHPIVTTTKLKN